MRCSNKGLLLKLILVLFTGVMGDLSAKPQILYENTPTNGINVYPLKSEWHGRSMTYKPLKIADKYWVSTGQDFFVAEYGKPLTFTDNWFKKNAYATGSYSISNGSLKFKTGRQGFSFGFGQSKTTPSALGIRFGSGWNQAKKDIYRLKLKLNQSGTTKWRFGYFAVKRGNLIYKQIKEFTVTGQGTQSFAGKLGFVRVVIPAPLVVG
ncbi:MAG: hypothetical protein L3J71_12735, partial [Victivallaceae bacterium]|nr:hypothetical protein [Victivallaceae bacterium]